MKVVGITRTKSANGVSTNLHLTDEFEAFYKNPENGRSAEGVKAVNVYVGGLDCSQIKVGMEIEIYYDKAITTSKGTFQPIKKIEIITK